VQLWSAAAEVSGEERRREIHREYFCVTAMEILLDDLVQNIYPIREHENPIHSLYVPPPTVVS
jgi:hypothetical protein